MTQRTALITGVSGQDGSYLARLLLSKGYRVIGTTRRAVEEVTPHLIAQSCGHVDLRTIDTADDAGLSTLLRAERPDELYHLAAQSVVHASWERVIETIDATGVGAARLLECVRREAPATRVVMASTSEIFGEAMESPQDEQTAIQPRSPYGAAKALAYWLAASYRRVHGMWVASAILYNHESPTRSNAFVTRKISQGVAQIAAGNATELRLGNLEGRRDWGHAADVVEALWRMAQLDSPEDLVIGTGESHSVRDFCEIAFTEAGLDYRDHVVQDERLFRPADSVRMIANSSRAHERLQWRPTRRFEDVVREMVRADLARVKGSTL